MCVCVCLCVCVCVCVHTYTYGGELMKQILVIFLACVLSHFSHVRLFETLWSIAHEAPLSMGFPRQEFWSGLPFPSPGDLPNPGVEPVSPALAGGFFTTKPPGKPTYNYVLIQI